jgi:hypothetical protein
MIAVPVSAAETAVPKSKPQPANVFNSPFGSTSTSRGFTDRHFEMCRKVDTTSGNLRLAWTRGRERR